MPESHVRRIYINESGVTLNVDILATESCVSGEIDTGTATSPVTVLTPSSGKRIDTRNIYLSTDSTSGEIEARFPTSGILLGKLYCAVHTMVTLDLVRFTGDVDEPIEISWSGLSTGAKIFYVIRYKEI